MTDNFKVDPAIDDKDLTSNVAQQSEAEKLNQKVENPPPQKLTITSEKPPTPPVKTTSLMVYIALGTLALLVLIAIGLAAGVHNGWLAEDTVGNTIIKNDDTYTIAGLDVNGRADINNFGTSLMPSKTNSLDIGSDSKKWKRIYTNNLEADGLSVSG